MNKIIKGLLLSLAVAVVAVSCKKEDEPKKVSVSEVAGEYIAVAATYLLHPDGTITTTNEIGGLEDLLEFDVMEVSVSGNKVIAKDSDGETFFESVDLVEAENGVGWNLVLPADFIAMMAEAGYETYGFENYELDGKKYQAFYDAAEETIDFSLAFVNSDENIPDIVFVFACSK